MSCGRLVPLLAFAALLCASTPEQIWKQAVTLHQAGQHEAAAEQYSELLKINGSFVPALSNLGAVYASLGRFEEAAAQYRKALEFQPEHAGIRLNFALALYKQSRVAEAATEFEKLLKTSADHAQARMLLADCRLRMGDHTAVIALLKDHEGSEDRAVAYMLGTAFIRDGQVGRGQRIIDRVFRDGSAEAHMLLGASQVAAQENKQALGTLQKAIALNPKLPELHSLYGMARLTDGDPAGAKESFLKELEHNPYDYEANLQLGALYRVEKDFEKATQYLSRARQIRPHSLALKYQLAALELANGDLTKATSMLEEVTKQAPDFVEGHITLATAYYRGKRKADGDRARATVDRLTAELQAREVNKQ